MPHLLLRAPGPRRRSVLQNERSRPLVLVRWDPRPGTSFLSAFACKSLGSNASGFTRKVVPHRPLVLPPDTRFPDLAERPVVARPSPSPPAHPPHPERPHVPLQARPPESRPRLETEPGQHFRLSPDRPACRQKRCRRPGPRPAAGAYRRRLLSRVRGRHARARGRALAVAASDPSSVVARSRGLEARERGRAGGP